MRNAKTLSNNLKNYKMELVTPGIGLMFWTVVIFTLLLILLKKFAWGPILESVDNRNKNIEDYIYKD